MTTLGILFNLGNSHSSSRQYVESKIVLASLISSPRTSSKVIECCFPRSTRSFWVNLTLPFQNLFGPRTFDPASSSPVKSIIVCHGCSEKLLSEKLGSIGEFYVIAEIIGSGMALKLIEKACTRRNTIPQDTIGQNFFCPIKALNLRPNQSFHRRSGSSLYHQRFLRSGK